MDTTIQSENLSSANSNQTKLTKEQKEAVGLLSIGTFLEYFDLMLYVHMAVLLNELFFPATDPHTKKLLTALAFCSTFVFRPIGALIFGHIGDKIGRKHTIMITTGIMSACCITMAMLPTYSELGLRATYVMIGCRVLQGMSSMGEVVGALLYLTESIKVPARYKAVALIPIFCDLGSMVALGVVTIFTSHGGNWRIAFGVGTVIALIGLIARTALRESTEFADARKRLAKLGEENNINAKIEEIQKINTVDKKSIISLFLLECMWPLCFYVSYVYCGDVLTDNFGYSSEEVIRQNFYITIIGFIGSILMRQLCGVFHPLLILRFSLIVNFIVYLTLPFFLNSINDGFGIGIVQSVIVIFATDNKFAVSAIYPHFPVFNRFKSAAFLYAISRALTYVATSFGIVYLVSIFGNFGISLALLVVSTGVAFGLKHFIDLERSKGNLVLFVSKS
jgi:MFS transporter, MHS family, proline/betaine transporter